MFTLTVDFTGDEKETAEHLAKVIDDVLTRQYLVDNVKVSLTSDEDEPEWPDHGREDIVQHDTEDTPAVVIRPGQPIHVFGNVDVFTGRYAAEEKLASLTEDGEPDFSTPHMWAYLRDVVTDV